MKTPTLASLMLTAAAAAALAAGETSPATKQLQVFPKNLARQHVGSNLFLFNATNQSFAPTEAAASWLDDDSTTGWPVLAGKQDYLLALSEPTIVNNFALSTRPTTGTVTIYGGDEPGAPGAKTWTVLAKDVPIDSINGKKLAKPFNRSVKYLLIETDIADPGPLYSLYLYGDRPAVNYQLHKRDTPIDVHAIFGPYVNNQTSFSVAALYAHSTVSYVNSPEGFLSWQKGIDENPESGVTLAPSTNEAAMALQLDASHKVSRVAVLTDKPAKGKLDIFVVPALPSTETTSATGEVGETVKVSNPAAVLGQAKAASLEGLTPAGTLVLDGSTTRVAADFAGAEGAAVLVRWTPETAGESLTIKELNAFNEISLSEYELALTPAAVAELAADTSKDMADAKDGKGMLPPKVGELITPRSPYLPGSLGFPPNVGRGIPRAVDSPVSD